MEISRQDLERLVTEDVIFWAYLWGVVSFWFGLSLMHSGSELNMFIYGGVLYARNRSKLEAALLRAVPAQVRKLLPSQRAPQ